MPSSERKESPSWHDLVKVGGLLDWTIAFATRPLLESVNFIIINFSRQSLILKTPSPPYLPNTQTMPTLQLPRCVEPHLLSNPLSHKLYVVTVPWVLNYVIIAPWVVRSDKKKEMALNLIVN